MEGGGLESLKVHLGSLSSLKHKHMHVNAQILSPLGDSYWKTLNWIYPQYLLTTPCLPWHTFPLILYFLISKDDASKQASIRTLKNKGSSVYWEVSQQKCSQILWVKITDTHTHKSQAQYCILNLENNLETLMHLMGRMVVAGVMSIFRICLNGEFEFEWLR